MFGVKCWVVSEGFRQHAEDIRGGSNEATYSATNEGVCIHCRNRFHKCLKWFLWYGMSKSCYRITPATVDKFNCAACVTFIATLLNAPQYSVQHYTHLFRSLLPLVQRRTYNHISDYELYALNIKFLIYGPAMEILHFGHSTVIIINVFFLFFRFFVLCCISFSLLPGLWMTVFDLLGVCWNVRSQCVCVCVWIAELVTRWRIRLYLLGTGQVMSGALGYCLLFCPWRAHCFRPLFRCEECLKTVRRMIIRSRFTKLCQIWARLRLQIRSTWCFHLNRNATHF